MADVRMTLQTRLVLGVFLNARLQEADAERFGAQICDETDLGPGTVYPIVARLLEAGWLEVREENADEAFALGRPARRYYRLTADGAPAAQLAMARAAERRPVGYRRSTGKNQPEMG